MKKGGYGIVYQEVMRNKNLTPEAKAIYAYLSSIAGKGDECYPSRDLMSKELAMSKNRLDKHLSILVAFGVVEKRRGRSGNLMGRNTYKIIHEAQVAEELKDIFRNIENKGIENSHLENKYSNNNSTNNNSANNNSTKKESINYQQIADMYNDTCVSFPRVTKLSDSRKKAIKARMQQYSLEDFKKLFEMAEGSSFLKGGNDRDWSANFDWLLKDANMAKVLDGNYTDNGSRQHGGSKQVHSTGFSNFTQRNYGDMSELERRIIEYW